MEMLAQIVVILFATAILILGVGLLIAWAILEPWWTIGIVVALVVAALVRDAIEVKKRTQP